MFLEELLYLSHGDAALLIIDGLLYNELSCYFLITWMSSTRSHAAMFPSREEKINRVYQDEDYIYPTLGSLASNTHNNYRLPSDQSDDEDMPLQKDDSWNPKIKMSKLGPKMDRPVTLK